MRRKLAGIALAVAIAFQFQGCAVTVATIAAVATASVSVAEDVGGIYTTYHNLKDKLKENNDTNRTAK